MNSQEISTILQQLGKYGEKDFEEIAFIKKNQEFCPIITQQPNFIGRIFRCLRQGFRGYHEYETCFKVINFLKKHRHLIDHQDQLITVQAAFAQKIQTSHYQWSRFFFDPIDHQIELIIFQEFQDLVKNVQPKEQPPAIHLRRTQQPLEPAKPAVPHFSLDEHLFLPCVAEANNPSIKQIKVLDQTELPGGHASCGFHAWKNGLIILALSHHPHPQKEMIDLLGDMNFYQNEVEPFLRQFHPTGGDIPLTALNEATHFFQQQDIDPIKFPKLYQLKAMGLNKKSLSFLTLTRKGIPEGKGTRPANKDAISITSRHALDNFTNGIQAINKPGPLTHVFVTGTAGHWVTMIMEKDANNQIRWYGIDSLHNQTCMLPHHGAILEKWVKDSIFQIESFQSTLKHVIWESFKPLLQELERREDEAVQQLDRPTRLALVPSFDFAIIHLQMIGEASRFLRENNLSDDTLYVDDVNKLQKIIGFYLKYLRSLPDLNNPEALQAFFSEYPPYQILANAKAFSETDNFSLANSILSLQNQTGDPIQLIAIPELQETSSLNFSRFLQSVDRFGKPGREEEYFDTIEMLFSLTWKTPENPQGSRPFADVLIREKIIPESLSPQAIIDNIVERLFQHEPNLILRIKKEALKMAISRLKRFLETYKLAQEIHLPILDENTPDFEKCQQDISRIATLIKTAIFKRHEQFIAQRIQEDQQRFTNHLLSKKNAFIQMITNCVL